jgi:DNA-binding transcriptional LysR family regulator
VNLVQEGFDLALRASGKLSDSSLVARKAGELEGELYASPGYLSAHGAPVTLDDLAQHRCVVFRPKDGEATWTLWGPEGEIERRVRGRIGGDDYLFVRGASLSGAGVAALPRLVAADDASAGRLVRVLPAYVLRGAALYVVYAAARTLPAKISAFRDFVLQWCSATGAPRSIPPEPARSSQRPPAVRQERARKKRTG